jgi:hypothetical protein
MLRSSIRKRRFLLALRLVLEGFPFFCVKGICSCWEAERSEARRQAGPKKIFETVFFFWNFLLRILLDSPILFWVPQFSSGFPNFLLGTLLDFPNFYFFFFQTSAEKNIFFSTDFCFSGFYFFGASIFLKVIHFVLLFFDCGWVCLFVFSFLFIYFIDCVIGVFGYFFQDFEAHFA